MPDPAMSCCRIHNRDGQVERRQRTRSTTDSQEVPTIAGLVPITDVMTRDVTCVRKDLPIEMVIELMVRQYIGCLPVVDDEGCPIGMITKRDVVERLIDRSDPAAPPRLCELAPCVAEQVMLPLAQTLGDHTTVAQAATLMALDAVHHIPVVSPKGILIGMVSSLDIVRWLARNDGFVRAS